MQASSEILGGAWGLLGSPVVAKALENEFNIHKLIIKIIEVSPKLSTTDVETMMWYLNNVLCFKVPSCPIQFNVCVVLRV